MATKTVAKTPTVAIARVLRSLGLKQGEDFRIKGIYEKGERRGTYVSILLTKADDVIAENADLIEDLAFIDGGWSFRVSIYYTIKGRRWVWVSNTGGRVRETAPVAKTTNEKAEPAPALKLTAKTPKVSLGAPKPAFGDTQDKTAGNDTDSYAGKAQKRFGSLYWACEYAGQSWFFEKIPGAGPRFALRFYTGAVRLTGWYLSGPALPAEGEWMGRTLSVAAEASESLILDRLWIADRIEEVKRNFPQGTRVQGVDSDGVTCMGTVNGAGWGVVSIEGHPNYGKPWVDVTWDEYPHNATTGRRSRRFVEELIKH